MDHFNIIPDQVFARGPREVFVADVRPPKYPIEHPRVVAATEGRDGSKTVVQRAMVTKKFDAKFWDKIAHLSAGENFSTATDLKVLRDGKDAYDARMKLIQEAKSSIMLATYELGDDEMTLALLRAMTDKARQGVKVILRFDGPAQSAALTFLGGENKEALFAELRRLEAAGGAVLAWGEDDDAVLGQGDHVKALITDGKTAITGGRNTRDLYFQEWRDYDVQVQGLAVDRIGHYLTRSIRESKQYNADPSKLRHIAATVDRFEKDLEGNRVWTLSELTERAKQGKPLQGTPLCTVTWSPRKDNRPVRKGQVENACTQALIEVINRSTKTFDMMTNYINVTEEVEAALLAAAKRGVKIRVVTTGMETTNSVFPYVNAWHHYDELMEAGIKIYETRTVRDHAKLYVADNELGVFGSYNVEPAADVNLAEQLHLTTDRALIDSFNDAFTENLEQHCTLYSDDQFGFWDRVGFFFVGLISWFLDDKV